MADRGLGSEDWNEKHRPKSLSEVWGNPSAVDEILRWADSWDQRIPAKRALLLYGPPGTGKTSAAMALAKDMGWSFVEMNASDARNADSIKNSVALGAVNETFTADGSFISSKDGGRKLIIIDEADSLYERGADVSDGDSALDKGGKRAILELITKTNQPVILIVNELYALTKDRIGAEFKRKTMALNFKRINSNTVFKRLNEIARREGIALEPEAARTIAARSGGDMRAAVNDLQALSFGKKRILVKDVDAMGARDTEKTIYDLMRAIFGGMSGKAAYELGRSIDESPDMTLLWVDENLPGAYRNPEDLARGYDMLARADIFLARASRKNNYRLWPYASYMMTGGVTVSKKSRYSTFSKFNFPYWLIRMSRLKEDRGIRTSVTSKIGKVTHASRADVIDDILPYVREIYKHDQEFRKYLSYSLNLSEKEVIYLLEDTRDSPMVKETMKAVHDLIESHGVPGQEINLFGGMLGPVGDGKREGTLDSNFPGADDKKGAPKNEAASKDGPEEELPEECEEKNVPQPSDQEVQEESAPEPEPEDDDKGGQASLFDF